MKNPILRYSVILGCITLVVALLLAAMNKITYPIIEENSANQRTIAMSEVLPEADNFTKINPTNINYDHKTAVIGSISEGLTQSGESVGYVLSITSHEGYGGDIELIVGVLKDNSVNRVKIISMSETAGLGSKAGEQKFLSQYNQKKSTLSVIKSGKSEANEISAISGATITSKAITNAINVCIETVHDIISSQIEGAEMKEGAQNAYNEILEQTQQEMNADDTYNEEIPDQTEETEQPAYEPDPNGVG